MQTSELPGLRSANLDALRGLAMVWMTLFHLSFDLNHFGMIKQDFYSDTTWNWQRTLIVSLFLLCAGAGQRVALEQGQNWHRFWQRWRQVAISAVLVSIGSWLMYKETFIYFGVLHGMAAMLIVLRLTARWGYWLWPMGVAAIFSKFTASYLLASYASGDVVALFNTPALNWIGWITQKPLTEDYVPLFPWIGVMWWGAAIAPTFNRWPQLQHSLIKPLSWLGRRSLSYYLLHQPVMISMLMALLWLMRP